MHFKIEDAFVNLYQKCVPSNMNTVQCYGTRVFAISIDMQRIVRGVGDGATHYQSLAGSQLFSSISRRKG